MKVFLLLLNLMLYACVPASKVEKKADCLPGETFNQNSKACVQTQSTTGGSTLPQPTASAPFDSTFQQALKLKQNAQQTITFTYSQPAGEKATQIYFTQILPASVNWTCLNKTTTVANTGTCDCTAQGVCQMTIAATSTIVATSFQYRVQNSNAVSQVRTIPVDITPDYQAVSWNTSNIPSTLTFTENDIGGSQSQVVVISPYGGTPWYQINPSLYGTLPNACQVISTSNISGTLQILPSASQIPCSCTAGLCSFILSPIAYRSGIAQMTVRLLNPNPDQALIFGYFSADTTLNITVNSVNNAPVNFAGDIQNPFTTVFSRPSQPVLFNNQLTSTVEMTEFGNTSFSVKRSTQALTGTTTPDGTFFDPDEPQDDLAPALSFVVAGACQSMATKNLSVTTQTLNTAKTQLDISLTQSAAADNYVLGNRFNSYTLSASDLHYCFQVQTGTDLSSNNGLFDLLIIPFDAPPVATTNAAMSVANLKQSATSGTNFNLNIDFKDDPLPHLVSVIVLNSDGFEGIDGLTLNNKSFTCTSSLLKTTAAGTCAIPMRQKASFYGQAFVQYQVSSRIDNTENSSILAKMDLTKTQSSSINTYAVTVDPVNQAPSFSGVATSVTVPSNAWSSITSIQLSPGLSMPPASSEQGQSFTSISASSSNQSYVNNNDIIINYTHWSAPLSLTIKTKSIVETQAQIQITLSVTDNGTDGLVSNPLTSTVSFTLVIQNSEALHNGWKSLKAYGPVVDQNGTQNQVAQAIIDWEDFTIPTGTLQGFNVYRSTVKGGQDFNTPLNTTALAAGIRTYTDSQSLISGQKYYYVVRPIVNGFVIASSEPIAEVEIPIPSANRVLLHRWAVNREVCTQMGKASLMNPPGTGGNFECPYNGPGATASNTYDLGQHFYLDRYEAGCPWTYDTNRCSNQGCIGTNDPTNALACGGGACTKNLIAGLVYYDRKNLKCYQYSGTTWGAYTGSANNQFYNQGLPPLSGVTQTSALSLCQQRSTTTRLPTRKEFIAAAAWPSTLNPAIITSYENGNSLNSTFACNTNSANGLSYMFQDSQIPLGAYWDSIAATLSSGQLIFRTGSNATKNCVSQYGAQDLIGNVKEWTMETVQFDGTSLTGKTSAAASALVPGTFPSIFANFYYAFDGDIGPSGFDGVPGSGTYNIGFPNWPIGTLPTSASPANWASTPQNFLLPVGLPFLNGSSQSYDVLAVAQATTNQDVYRFCPSSPTISGTSTYNTCADWSTNYVASSGVYSGTGGFLSGGGSSDQNGAGRYFLEVRSQNLQPIQSTDQQVGFRCITPVP